MVKLRVSTVLDAPPDVVWAYVQDIESHVQWMHDAVRIRFLTDRRTGVGTRFECDTKVGPFQLTDEMEITEWSPGRAMGVRHRGLVTGTGRFTLQKARRGRTRFTWTERLHFPLRRGGPVAARAAKPIMKRVWRRSLRQLAARFSS
jgi:uncharacterized protein YndB with AHSA1/START domain